MPSAVSCAPSAVLEAAADKSLAASAVLNAPAAFVLAVSAFFAAFSISLSVVFIQSVTSVPNLDVSIAPSAICLPLIVPTVILAALRLITSMAAASIVPLVILLAVKSTILASVMLPSAI